MDNENNTGAAQVVTEVGLPELRDALKAACLSGAPVTLSHLAAGALHYAMTTPPDIPVAVVDVMSEEGLQQLKTEAQALAADGGNWSMDVGCMFVLAMIERIEAGVATAPAGTPVNELQQAPRLAGYIDRKDLVRLSNCRATIWPGTNEIDAVPVYLGAPPAPAAGSAFEEDPVDIVRTLLCTVDHYWSLPDEKRELYPSPTSELSPLMQAARRACVERGFTAGGLAIEPAGRAT